MVIIIILFSFSFGAKKNKNHNSLIQSLDFSDKDVFNYLKNRVQDKRMKISALFIILAFAIIGGCNNGNEPQPTPMPTPTPGCIPIEGDFEQLSEFADCPAEGLVQICNNYICLVPGSDPDPLQLGIEPLKCIAGSCVAAECQLLDTLFREVVGSGVFTIDEILGNSNFAGTVIIDQEEEIEYECSPIVQ